MADSVNWAHHTYVCRAGHLTEADGWDLDHADATGTELPFDYTQLCRRKVWHMIGPGPIDQDMERCRLPVVPARKFPQLYSAFLLGGEDAVRAIVIDVLDHK